MMKRKLNQNTGFTLMEMLVVIAIIVLLAGVLVPVLSKAKEAARKNDIRHQVTQLKTAWELSFVEVKRFPTENWGTMEQDAVEYLHGANNMNFIYMDFTTNDLNNPVGMQDKYLNKAFNIALDNGVCVNDDSIAYNGRVTYAGNNLETHVAVWHNWKDDSESSDDIRSWKEN